jgi:LytS/YehU family sensor histidine kinase
MAELKLRLTRTALIIIPAFAIFFVMCYLYYTKYFHVSTIICQFVVIAAITVVTGHLSMLYIKQRKHEQEIEQLKVENLQSRCDALINQINPHFFFNSLNSINSLARKVNDEEVLAYVDTLSDVFRYILQSDKKGLVALRDELEFVNAFRYMMGVRYANKLSFDIDIDESKLDLSIPVLSLLPVIDNVITHNRIDSDYYMNVTIEVNEKDELVISNPIYPKLTPPDTNGTGIKNLENRFALMMNTKIRIEDDEQLFRVYLPLK